MLPLKRCVFKRLRKVLISSVWRSAGGKQFHNFGLDTLKDRSPYDTDLVFGTFNRDASVDLSVLPGRYAHIMS